MNITAKQIAEMLNVSKQAVYSVLSNKPKCLVSPEKREKILFLAKAYHYKPNISAVSLNGKSTYQIGAVIDSFGEIESKIISVMASKLEVANYTLKASKITSINQGLDMIQQYISTGADAVIFSGSRLQDVSYENYRVPLLSLGGEFGPDYLKGTFLITEHLIREHHHKKIVHIASEQGDYPKFHGYCEAMKKYSLKPLPVLHTIMNMKFKEELTRYLDQGVTAFVTTGDETASRLIYLLRSMGLRVPEDVVVTGFDGFGDFPEITSVINPVEEVAELGCKLLFKKIKENILRKMKPKLTVPELLLASSCHCPPIVMDNIAEFYTENGSVIKISPVENAVCCPAKTNTEDKSVTKIKNKKVKRSDV